MVRNFYVINRPKSFRTLSPSLEEKGRVEGEIESKKQTMESSIYNSVTYFWII